MAKTANSIGSTNLFLGNKIEVQKMQLIVCPNCISENPNLIVDFDKKKFIVCLNCSKKTELWGHTLASGFMKETEKKVK